MAGRCERSDRNPRRENRDPDLVTPLPTWVCRTLGSGIRTRYASCRSWEGFNRFMSDSGKADAVQAEIDALGKEREMLERVRGKWALMHETEILDFFDSREEAVRAGYKRLRDVPFVVRQVPLEND